MTMTYRAALAAIVSLSLEGVITLKNVMMDRMKKVAHQKLHVRFLFFIFLRLWMKEVFVKLKCGFEKTNHRVSKNFGDSIAIFAIINDRKWEKFEVSLDVFKKLS